MKYEVTYSCGHTGTVQIYGSAAERERKLRWYQASAVCPDCYKTDQTVKTSNDCDEVMADLLSKGFTREQIKAQANMSKSSIFKSAHQIAKSMTAQYPGTDYRVNFALALREAYRIIKAVKAAA